LGTLFALTVGRIADASIVTPAVLPLMKNTSIG